MTAAVAPGPADRSAPFRVAPARAPSSPLVACAVLAALGLLAGLVGGRSDVAAFGAAFAVLAAAAVASAPLPDMELRIELDAERVLEGDVVSLQIGLRSGRPLDRVDVLLAVPDGLVVVEGANPTAVHLDAAVEQVVDVGLRAERWGLQPLGLVAVRVRDRTGLLRWEAAVDPGRAVRVLPGPAALDRLIRPARTRVHAGTRLSRARGEGTEFADIRPFAAGDLARDVNWRLTARRGEPWVNLRHPERSTDVVVFLDTFDAAAMPDGVRAVAALAAAHLDQRDRVGYIGFGGSVRWLEPGGGRRQGYRLVDALLTTRVYESDAWRTLRAVPRRMLPPNALVIAVSPLHDERTVGALTDLRSRGIDVAVLEVVPAQQPTRTRTVGPLAERLWRLRRRTVRSHLLRLGLPVATWDGSPLQQPVSELMALRRRVGRAG